MYLYFRDLDLPDSPPTPEAVIPAGTRVGLTLLGLLPPRLESEVVGLKGPTSSTSMSSSSSEHSPSCSSQLLMLLSSSSEVKSLADLFFPPTEWEPVPARASTLNRWRDEVVDPVVTPPILDRWWWWWSFLSDEPWRSFWCCICWCRSLFLKFSHEVSRQEQTEKTRQEERRRMRKSQLLFLGWTSFVLQTRFADVYVQEGTRYFLCCWDPK